MPLKIAIQMDHVSTVNIAGDTSFALSLEAQRRGHSFSTTRPIGSRCWADRFSLASRK